MSAPRSSNPSHRVIAYFDIDCFYAQAEILRRPGLEDRPVGVTQKFLVVTCNYVARQLGVPKMAPIQEAKQRCPDLVLINGEDLTPYRAASKRIMAVLSRFGILERRGLDEAALDITMEVFKRSISNPSLNKFPGHVLGLKDKTGSGLDASISLDSQDVDLGGSDYLLMLGSHLVEEIRAAVETETGFRCSSGIASNKMLAKLVSSVNKPNKQTCLLGSGVSAFLQPLPVRKLPGVGHQMESLLKNMGATKVSDLQKSSLQQLSSKFGGRVGLFLHDSCRGMDNSPVQDKGPPKSLSVEDSFQPCTAMKHAEETIRSLAPDLISRLDEDREENGRIPKVFTVKWRYPGNWAFKSASAPMPMEVLSTIVSLEKRLDTVVEVAMKLLTHALGGKTFALVVLNIGATNFTASSSGSIGASHDIRTFLHSSSKSSIKKTKVVSKREARMNREVCEKERAAMSMAESVQLDGDLKSITPVRGLLSHASQKDVNAALQMKMQNLSHDSQKDVNAAVQMKMQNYGEENFDVHDTFSTREKVHYVMHKDLFSLPSRYSDAASVDLLAYENGSASSSSEVHSMDGDLPDKSFVVDAFSTPSDRGSSIIDSSSCYTAIVDCKGSFDISDMNGSPDQNVAGFQGNLNESIKFSQEILTEMDANAYGTSDGLVIPTYSHFLCEKCGQELKGDTQLRQEHDDYHLAVELHAQEQSLAGRPCPTPAANISRAKIKISKRSFNHHSSLKRAKTQNGTLDCFVFRSKD